MRSGGGIMGNPYIGEIRIFGGNFAPLNWLFCDGRLLSISENPVLFQLLGTTYGGDGQQTFALPDLRSRVPVHQGTLLGTSYVIGQSAGTENVTLITQQMPLHNHVMQSSNTSPQLSPNGTLPGVASSGAGTPQIYGAAATKATTLNPISITTDGQSVPHNNIQPYLAVSFIISLSGIFPSQQ
jgi:microcystin-dependent protein